MTRAQRTLLAGGMVLLAAVGALVFSPSGPPSKRDPTSSPRATQSGGSPPVFNASKAARAPEVTKWKGLPELPQYSISPHRPDSTDHQRWLTTRIAALEDASWFDDPDSMRRILSELRNPLSEIRSAARSAIVTFGSRHAVPYLEMIAATTYDDTERNELGKVIEFLKLPPITEAADPREESIPNPHQDDASGRQD